MLVLGGGLIAAVVPVQDALSRLDTAEFIAAISIGALLIMVAAILYFLLSRQSLDALRQVSTASSSTAAKAFAGLTQAIDKLSDTDAMTQRDAIAAIKQVSRDFAGQISAEAGGQAPAEMAGQTPA
jgi:hypothetical protein